MKVAVIVNARAGSIGADRCEQRIAQLRAAFERLGVETELIRCDAARITETARSARARGFDAVVAAGGDGTVSAVASGLAGGDVPLGVLPLGTLNHFARDLGMPLDLEEAAQALVKGTSRRIDLGEVNGRVFVNNSSIGLYPEMVTIRDRERRRSGRGKWTAMFLAASRVLRRFPLLSVVVETPRRRLVTRTPFVLIGNNEYGTSVLSLGQRKALDTGRLSLYTMRCRGRLHMFWVLVRALLGKIEAVRDFEAERVTEAWVGLRRRQLTVALDGEITRMTSPLHYRSRPGALRVLVPPAELRTAAGDVAASPRAPPKELRSVEPEAPPAASVR